jgi:hypothetical protein
MENKTKMHQWIKTEKAKRRHSYGYLGGLIGYSDVGFSKALKACRISYEHMLIISEKLGKKDEFLEYMKNEPKDSKDLLYTVDKEMETNDLMSHKDLLRIAVEFSENYEQLKGFSMVKNIITIEVLKERFKE